jgi:DNA topoisomerase-3
MSRLVDQVEDPALKAALENPSNPNEPKGLGTAATRDTILPKLEKSLYVILLKGRDPPIQVTEVGLAFIAAVRRVFPSYGDPVSRAVFEAELAEIGRATTRTEAAKRAQAFKERTRARLAELIEAIARSEIVSVEPSRTPAHGDRRAPTKAMLAFATAIARRKGLALPRGLRTDAAICRQFLDQHAKDTSPGSGGPRRPTPAMTQLARRTAEHRGLQLPISALTDFAACKSFLD